VGQGRAGRRWIGRTWAGHKWAGRTWVAVPVTAVTAMALCSVPGEAGTGQAARAQAWAQAPRYTSTKKIAPGVTYRTFATSGAGGRAVGNLLVVNLRNRRVGVGPLRAPAVASRRKVSAMANARRAVGGVNGDFFNLMERRPGVPATGSSSGPMVDGGRPLKAAVPEGQRFGPTLPPGTSAGDVIGVGTNGRGYVGRLRLTGTVRAGKKVLPLRGLNQYAVPVGGTGLFTSAWGSASRRRAVCGTDTYRDAPCSTDTAEVTVRKGRVVKVRRAVGGGRIPKGTTVLVAREGAAQKLRTLRPGTRVRVRYRLTGRVRFRFAIGGLPILRNGRTQPGLVRDSPAPRTAAGFSRDGRRMYLVVVDGRSSRSNGVTLTELAALVDWMGADDAVNLDGGGSTTMVVRRPGGRSATVRNKPSDGAERRVPNGIGVFRR
jgi:hypothetical protein